MRGKKTRLLVKAALVGAIYAALTLIPPFSAISFGPVQFRLSEVLMFTALFSPAYDIVPGWARSVNRLHCFLLFPPENR